MTMEPPQQRNLQDIEYILRWVKYAVGIVGSIGGWALGLTVWLVMMRADVSHLQSSIIPNIVREHSAMHSELNRIDQVGTRALETIRNRQQDVLATNVAQDARLRELENTLSAIRQQQSENKIWIEQLVGAIRAFSHPVAPLPIVPRTPPP